MKEHDVEQEKSVRELKYKTEENWVNEYMKSGCEWEEGKKNKGGAEIDRTSFHARINEVLKKYKDANFGRHSKKGDTGSTFRGFLRARTGKKNQLKEESIRNLKQWV